MKNVKQCSKPECEGKLYARTLCRKCYDAARYAGEITCATPKRDRDRYRTYQRTYQSALRAGEIHGRTCTMSDCARPLYARNRCQACYQRGLYSGEIAPTSNRGRKRRPAPDVEPDVTHRQIHDRLRRDRGPASNYDCEHCHGRGREWAYDHRDPNELVGTDHRGYVLVYSADLSHYMPLCTTCHARFDSEQEVSV